MSKLHMAAPAFDGNGLQPNLRLPQQDGSTFIARLTRCGRLYDARTVTDDPKLVTCKTCGK